MVHEFIRLVGTDEIPNNPEIGLLLTLLRNDERPGAHEAVVESLREMLGEKIEVGSRWIGGISKKCGRGSFRICASSAFPSRTTPHRCGLTTPIPDGEPCFRFSALDEVDSSLLLARPVIYQDVAPRLPGPDVWARSIIGLTAQSIGWISSKEVSLREGDGMEFRTRMASDFQQHRRGCTAACTTTWDFNRQTSPRFTWVQRCPRSTLTPLSAPSKAICPTSKCTALESTKRSAASYSTARAEGSLLAEPDVMPAGATVPTGRGRAPQT